MSLYQSARRVPRAAVEQAAGAMHEIQQTTRALLIEHARDHVTRTGGLLECPLCLKARERLHLIDEVLAGDSFV